MFNSTKPCIQKSQRRYKAYWKRVIIFHFYTDTLYKFKKNPCSVIGIIVVCGPISTRFVYSMDDLAAGDANMMIEVMRQAFHDLGKLLANYKNRSYAMPRTAFLQFDNCGVNKVSCCFI